MSKKLSQCLSTFDLQRQARKALPRVIYDYLEGGADDEQCLTENESRIRAHRLKPRYLVDIAIRSQQIEVLGYQFDSPIGISPMGMLGMVRHGGDLILARVAARARMPFILSGASNASIESIAECAPHAWMQIYPCKSLEIQADMLKRAESVGIRTLVVAVDVPLHSKRERNIRSGWVRPYKPSLGVMAEALMHPSWVMRYLRHGLPVMENFVRYAPVGISARDLTSFYASQVPAPHQWDMIRRLRDQWRGNLVLKGILAPEDALCAVQAGVDGIIVSNHGGRQLDRSVASIDALPCIVQAVGHSTTVMFDSGIRRGADVLIAMSLGAKVCFAGRAAAYGLAAFGEQGAQRAMDILRTELDLALGQVGCPDVNDVGPQFLWGNHASDALHLEQNLGEKRVRSVLVA